MRNKFYNFIIRTSLNLLTEAFIFNKLNCSPNWKLQKIKCRSLSPLMFVIHLVYFASLSVLTFLKLARVVSTCVSLAVTKKKLFFLFRRSFCGFMCGPEKGTQKTFTIVICRFNTITGSVRRVESSPAAFDHVDLFSRIFPAFRGKFHYSTTADGQKIWENTANTRQNERSDTIKRPGEFSSKSNSYPRWEHDKEI